MARPRLQATFFARKDGTVLRKARPLHGAERRVIFDRDGGRCKICGKVVQFFRSKEWHGSRYYRQVGHVDHIIPRSRGGQNNAENLRLLCETCNESRGAAI